MLMLQEEEAAAVGGELPAGTALLAEEAVEEEVGGLWAEGREEGVGGWVGQEWRKEERKEGKRGLVTVVCSGGWCGKCSGVCVCIYLFILSICVWCVCECVYIYICVCTCWRTTASGSVRIWCPALLCLVWWSGMCVVCVMDGLHAQ
jgi:hypothetical protein